MAYPEQINLPFNYAAIKDDFVFHHQTALPDDAPAGYWAIIQGGNIVVNRKKSETRYTLPEGALPDWLVPAKPPVTVGMWHGKPLRAFTISRDIRLADNWMAEPFNAGANILDMQTLTLGGIAKQVLHWLSRSRFCARCGTANEPIYGTWGKRCPACAAQHFPHLHPCAIVLVKRAKEVLLTRKAEWAPGRYSLVAGFLDFGESLEECAIREVQEETGISIRNVRYVGSQNWPFPAQLMAGFTADYESGDIVVDHHELEDARWFHVDALPDLPLARSISRHIIDTYAV